MRQGCTTYFFQKVTLPNDALWAALRETYLVTLWWEAEKNCIMRRYITYTLHQILLG
jgi:hypothetical protein